MHLYLGFVVMWPWVLAWLSALSCSLSRITGLGSVLQISRCPNVNPQRRAGPPLTLHSLSPNPKGPRGPLGQRRDYKEGDREKGLHVAGSDPEPTGLKSLW